MLQNIFKVLSHRATVMLLRNRSASIRRDRRSTQLRC
jgi:hypothetical protein